MCSSAKPCCPRHGAETVLCAMPLFHSYGMAMGLFLAASAAATLVVLPRYRPDDVFDAVARERVTLFPAARRSMPA